MTNQSDQATVGDIWLIRMKDPDIAAALVKVEVLEVHSKTVELEPMGTSFWAVSRGHYEIGKDFVFVERLGSTRVTDELAQRRSGRG